MCSANWSYIVRAAEKNTGWAYHRKTILAVYIHTFQSNVLPLGDLSMIVWMQYDIG
jgi:hypothetical protein